MSFSSREYGSHLLTKNVLLTKIFTPHLKMTVIQLCWICRSFPQGYAKISRGHFETTIIYHIEKRAGFEIAHFEGIVSLRLIIYECGNLVSRKH